MIQPSISMIFIQVSQSVTSFLLRMKSMLMRFCLGGCLRSIRTGHTNNIFSVKDIHNHDCNDLISCAADGRVIRTLVDQDISSLLHQHTGRAHRLSMIPDGSDRFMSCGEDGVICLYDLRVSNHPVNRMTIQSDNHHSLSVYSISVNPSKHFEFAVGGSFQRAFVYDQRFSREHIGSFCPNGLVSSDEHITSLKYNYSGREIIASYNDDYIYSFDTTEHLNSSSHVPMEPGFRVCFKGHRNLQTIKQLNYLGPRDEYVISGSDCGHIFIWDREGVVVKVMKGDCIGAVNCLSPHPFLPLLVTSGLESNAKLWGADPSNEQRQSQEEIDSFVARNEETRRRNQGPASSTELFLRLLGLDSFTPDQMRVLRSYMMRVTEAGALHDTDDEEDVASSREENSSEGLEGMEETNQEDDDDRFDEDPDDEFHGQADEFESADEVKSAEGEPDADAQSEGWSDA